MKALGVEQALSKSQYAQDTEAAPIVERHQAQQPPIANVRICQTIF